MSKFKERMILLGGTIGIGAISLAITLTVYNVQFSNKPKRVDSDVNKVVYNDGLTEEQRRVAENLIAELDKLEITSNKSTIDDEENIEIEKQNVGNKNENSTPIVNNVENINLVYEKKAKNEPVEDVIDNSNLSEELIETIAKVNEKISFIKPVEGEIGMVFSDEKLVYSKTLNEWLTHKGIDILASEGVEVKVSADGVVKDMYNDSRYGFTIVVEHDDGYVSKYSGVTENNELKIGNILKQGDIVSHISKPCGFEIGEGSHLHYEILKDGVNIEPEFN